MSVSLAILAGRQPQLFDALISEAETYTDVAPAAESEPYCRECGASGSAAKRRLKPSSTLSTTSRRTSRVR
jgi:hypothetical protein